MISVHRIRDGSIDVLYILCGSKIITTIVKPDFIDWDYTGGDSDFGHWMLNKIDAEAGGEGCSFGQSRSE